MKSSLPALPVFVARTPFGLVLREASQAEREAFDRLAAAFVAGLEAQDRSADARPLYAGADRA